MCEKSRFQHEENSSVHHAATKQQWRKERDLPFCSWYFELFQRNSLQNYQQIKLKWICIFKMYSSISVQPKIDLLKFIVIKNATDLE